MRSIRSAFRVSLLLRVFVPCAFASLCICALAQSAASTANTTSVAPDARLEVKGDVEKPLSLSGDDLRHMPRTTLRVTNPHEGKGEVYEGVRLEELLKRAGAPQGSKLRGPAMAAYVEADAADGYRVIFSIAELDSDFQDSEIIVADTMDGAALPDKVGPLRLVVPHDRRPARWIRMLQSITVVRVAKAP
jgi:DMSO/TMAO reductase YedYZ molybdopterin-dependent catalytic subunit